MEKGFSLVPEEEKKEGEDQMRSYYFSTVMMKKVSFMAAPMVAVAISQYLLQVISMIMAGHLDELSLSAVAIAMSLTNVTGFSLLVGLAGALETLCGQAFGAEQFRKISTYTYGSMLFLLLLCFPISLLWVFTDKLLVLFHQDPLISKLACRYSIWLIPALFGSAVLQPMTRFFQSQGLVLPLFLSSVGALCFHIPFCWLLVYKLRFGIAGAALSIGASYWFNVVLLWLFMRYTSLYRETKNFKAKEIFLSMKQFIALAIPSAMMLCFEWWSFEIVILLSGLLPNSKLETSVISICTYVSNELGAGNPKAARAAANSAILLSVIDGIIVSITLYLNGGKWGYIFGNVNEVARYATEITPFLCLSIAVDSLLAVFSGIVRGAGWQHIGAYSNVGSYYLIGIPVGAILCFLVKFRAKGLWIGILIGSTLNSIIIGLVTFCTNWEKEAAKARDRVIEMTPQGNEVTESMSKEDGEVLLEDMSEKV